MAGTIPKVIDDGLLRCKLCVNPFTSPKILPCLHVFCQNCLKKYIGSIPRERHKSAVLDPKVIEDALNAGSSLDQEIPIHGYDDVVGNYPSLPKMSKSARSSKQSFKASQSRVEGEYSEVASPEDDGGETANQKNLSLGVYTLEKALPTPNADPSLPTVPLKAAPRSKSDPIDERKVTEHLQGHSQSARSSQVVVEDSGQRTNTYLPMDRVSPRNSQKALDQLDSKSVPDIGTLNKYEVMASSIAVESKNTTKKPATANADSSVPIDKPLQLVTPTSPDSYDVTPSHDVTPSQSMQLTGFGLASPVPMSFFKNNKPPSKPESIYQSEHGIHRVASNVETVRGGGNNGVNSGGLSKRTSQSVDMLSSACVSGDKLLTKQTSEGDLKGLPFSLTATHSHSTGDMMIDEEETMVTTSTSDQTISMANEKHGSVCHNSIEKLTYSPTSGHDGYETPLTQRKPSSQASPTDYIGSSPKMSPVDKTGGNEVTPSLPPKQNRSGSDRFSWTGDSVSLQSIEMAPAPPVPRMKASPKSEESGGVRRRLAVGETIISPTQSDPDANPELWRDSVFVDHIYEEIQYDTSQKPPRRLRGSKTHASVPMMRPIRSNKTISKHSTSSAPKGSPKKPSIPAREEFNPRVQKAKNLLKKSKQSVQPKHEGRECDSQPGGLQVGGKLMRKTSVLLDESGFPYISDHFEKVTIHHNNEDIELIYSEVSDIASSSQQRPSASPIFASESVNFDNSSEMACPTCQSLFQLPDGDVDSLPSCTFIENLKEARDLENTLRPSCKNCKQKAEFKCLECDKYLCWRCNDTHKWFKVVQGHQVMTLSELHSGKYTNQIMVKKQEVCPNHCNEPPVFYCDTCDHAVCKECAHCYHRRHPCLPITEVADRGTSLLNNFQSMTGPFVHQFQTENLQLDKYRMQYNDEKKRLGSEIINQYVKATKLLEESYQELLRHIDQRYNEEIMYINEIQKRNKQFLTRVEQTNKLADQVTEFGNDCDVIHMTKLLTQNLLDMENCQPMRLENKMEVHFTPLSSVRAIDVLPLIGQASREYKPIKKFTKLDPSANQSDWGVSTEPIKHLHTFTPKTESDKKGCKPTGIALTRDDNIVLVDDINRKIKIFTEEGVLAHEIVPTNREELVDPWDVTVTNYGNFAVTDRGSKKVKIFDPDGDLVCEFGPHLASPWGICCNQNGDLIVTDIDHKCVFVHDSNGNIKFKINVPGKLAKFPEYVTTNSMGDIIVSDLKAHCVYVFNLLGQFLFKIGPKDTKNPKIKIFHSPCGIYTDSHDNILVADYEMVRVSKFNKNGRFMSHFLTYMDSLQAPQSLIVNKKGHVILSDGNFIKTFSVDHTVRADLELKPKTYHLRQDKGERQQQMKETGSIEETNGVVVSEVSPRLDGEEVTTTPATEGDGRAKHVTARSMKSDPGSEWVPRSRSSRSNSSPRYHGNGEGTLPTYGSPSLILRAIQDYDTPRISVKKIKERLTSMDRSNSSRRPRTGDHHDDGKGVPNPVIRNQETSKVSIGKVKEQLLSKDGAAPGTTATAATAGPTKPKLQPKPSFKQISEYKKDTEKAKAGEGSLKVLGSETNTTSAIPGKASINPLKAVTCVDRKTDSNREEEVQSETKNKMSRTCVTDGRGHTGMKVADSKVKVVDSNVKAVDSKVKASDSKTKVTDSKVKGSDSKVNVVVSTVPNEEKPGDKDLVNNYQVFNSVLKPKESGKNAGVAIETKMSPMKPPEKKKSSLKPSPSMSRKDQKSKKSPKVFRSGRKSSNKGAES